MPLLEVSDPKKIYTTRFGEMCIRDRFNTVYTLLTLAVSVFALTSLDTGTRLGRYMFTELFVREGEDPTKIPGFRGFLAKPMVCLLYTSRHRATSPTCPQAARPFARALSPRRAGRL